MSFVTLRDFSSVTGKRKKKVPNKILEEFVDFFLGTQHWHDDMEMIERRVKRLRADIANVAESVKKVA